MVEWSSPGLARIAAIVRDRTGLVFPAMRVADVEAVVRRAMSRRGVRDVWEFAGLLDHDPRVRDAVVAELTIGETYFNRDGAQFELLRTRLLPHLLEQRTDRPVRVWSAGCASGEEPYSIAMLLSELDAAGRAEIVGTDISRQRLQDAQRAIYSRWSLRGMPLSLQQRYFMPRGRYFELRMHIRSTVDFRYLNLAEDHFPSLSAGIWGMDVILCRNVLIYFDRETVAAVAGRLIASLSDDGYLILGASDPAIAEMVDCDVVATDAGLIYRRAGAGPGAVPQAGGQAGRMAPDAGNPAAPPAAHAPRPADMDAVQPAAGAVEPAPPDAQPRVWSTGVPDAAADGATDAATTGLARGAADGLKGLAADQADGTAPESAPALPTAVDPLEQIEAAYSRRDFAAVRGAAERAAEAGRLDASGWALWLRALANQGCLDEAGRVAARALEAGGATAELLYLSAVLQLQAGRPLDAAAVARRALYLDRGLIVGHLTAAEAQRQLGDMDAARRALRNAGTLLAALPPESVVPASDGETAGRLAQLVQVKLRLIEAVA